jgi:hypothetical protein
MPVSPVLVASEATESGGRDRAAVDDMVKAIPTFGTGMNIPPGVSQVIQERLSAQEVLVWQTTASTDLTTELFYRSSLSSKLSAIPFNCCVARWLESTVETHSFRYWLLTEDKLIIINKAPPVAESTCSLFVHASCCCLVPSRRSRPDAKVAQPHPLSKIANEKWRFHVKIWNACSSLPSKDHLSVTSFHLSKIEAVDVVTQRQQCGCGASSLELRLKAATNGDAAAQSSYDDPQTSLLSPDLEFGMQQRIMTRCEEIQSMERNIDQAVNRALSQVTFHEW